MPTILFVMGWRFFFYSNEMNETIHIHCKKGDKECKCWLDRDNFALEEAYGYIEKQWDKLQKRIAG